VSVFISCILATRNRRSFCAQAIRCFERQSYVDCELIVVDDGEDAVEDLCAGRKRITYIHLAQRTLLGTKLNLGIERASGVALHKMDDDDYYHPDFLRTAALRLDAAQDFVIAWDCFLVLMAGEAVVRYSGHGWAAGGTLCFFRALWERAPFQDLPRSVDRCFLIDHDYRVDPICAPELYLLVRHGANTWTRMNDLDTDQCLRSLPLYPKSLEELMDTDDASFYRGLPHF
jgi:glycosyltransferase involved in cell wall biosynthesis